MWHFGDTGQWWPGRCWGMVGCEGLRAFPTQTILWFCDPAAHRAEAQSMAPGLLSTVTCTSAKLWSLDLRTNGTASRGLLAEPTGSASSWELCGNDSSSLPCKPAGGAPGPASPGRLQPRGCGFFFAVTNYSTALRTAILSQQSVAQCAAARPQLFLR